MSKIEFIKNQITDDSIDSALFLRYIESFGFNPSNYENILELVQSVKGSMSQFLREYNQYLLSEKVSYTELEELGIKGALGYFSRNGICIPKSLQSDYHFFYRPVKRLYTPHSYSYPDFYETDVIIANGISSDITNIIGHPQDIYLGFCMDETNENLDSTLESYKHFLELINRNSRNEYILAHDKISSSNKKLCLIRKK